MVLYIPPSVLAAEITRRLTPEARRVVGAAGEPAFQNGWGNLGGAFAGASFYKDPLGRVHVRGAVSSGTNGSVVFTLPLGYRPDASLAFGTTRTASATGMTRVDVRANGEVFVASGTGTETHLTGISFRAA